MRKSFLCALFCFIGLGAFATHNRAGEITFKHISGLTYEITLVTYTYTPSPADRPTLTVFWGDQTSSVINRTQKINLVNDVSKNIYVGSHTFSGQGTFIISMEDPNRNGGIVNIPNSINTPFYIETMLQINPFLGFNNSPKLLNAPIDNGCVGFPFYHNPSAFDIDGDSLSYSLVSCKAEYGTDIIGYSFPQASTTFNINPISGLLSWENPIIQGEFNVAIKVKEWRNGVEIGYVIRDMQIDIGTCNNHPPIIQSIFDTCIEVGSPISFIVKATDIDNNAISLTGTGGPLALSTNPATFPQPTVGIGSVQSVFSWIPSCDQVQKYPYQVNFKAQDNGTPIYLVDFEDVRIKVVAPSPKNLLAIPKGNHIELQWTKSACSNAIGYDIYRKNGYIGYLPAICETGVPAWTAYVKIAHTYSLNDTFFIDNNNGYGLIHGPSYCYMVVAVFADGAESYPSLETCATLIKDVPVITHVTIDSTSFTNGIATVKWSKPTQIDTNQTPGPFKYLIYHSTQNNLASMVLVDSLNNLNDTVYTLNLINSTQFTHYFRIDFIHDNTSNRFVMGETQIASSIFLSTVSSDNKISISWNEFVPWTNTVYIIYKKNAAGVYDSIAYTNAQHYSDTNLINGISYCYKVKSIGAYSSSLFVNPIINWSQEICAEPIDNEKPCAPTLFVSTECRQMMNNILWTNQQGSCSHDIVGYKLYFKPSVFGDFNLIYTSNSSFDTSFTHMVTNTITGCYTVVAIDSFNNISEFSQQVCIDIDSCDIYRLPNVFTPNQDNVNDRFQPFPYDFVDKVDMHIFNRWGELVFNTTNPDINWDGTHQQTKKDCADGVYFFVCIVTENMSNGLREREIIGTVTIMRK